METGRRCPQHSGVRRGWGACRRLRPCRCPHARGQVAAVARRAGVPRGAVAEAGNAVNGTCGALRGACPGIRFERNALSEGPGRAARTRSALVPLHGAVRTVVQRKRSPTFETRPLAGEGCAAPVVESGVPGSAPPSRSIRTRISATGNCGVPTGQSGKQHRQSDGAGSCARGCSGRALWGTRRLAGSLIAHSSTDMPMGLALMISTTFLMLWTVTMPVLLVYVYGPGLPSLSMTCCVFG